MEHETTYACVEYDLGEDQRLEGMCRVCATSGCELTPVFDSAGQSEGILDLINNHLPILVRQPKLLNNQLFYLYLIILKNFPCDLGYSH